MCINNIDILNSKFLPLMNLTTYNEIASAIYNLEPSKVQKLLDTIIDHSIINNLLESTISKLNNSSIPETITTIVDIKFKSFASNNPEYHPKVKQFLEIIEIICKKFPWLINHKCYIYPEAFKIKPIIDILNRYHISKPDDKQCIICISPYQRQLIKKPCGCLDNYVHLNCLAKEINLNCQTCNLPYDHYRCPLGRLCYPKLNIYNVPLLSDTYHFVDPSNKFEQLEYSCAYLCIDRVKELLDETTDQEFRSYIDNFPLNGTFRKNDGFILMKKKLFSNISETDFPVSFNQLNNLLIHKCIDGMSYYCLTDIKITFGKYLWCGNMRSPNGSGFTLTNSCNTDTYGNPYTHMMSLTLDINHKILRDCDFYDIYTETGFLLGYNVEPLKPMMNVFKRIEPNLFGTELEIVFSKKKELSDEEKEIIKKHLMRLPKTEIYKMKVKIPNLIQYGEKIDCNICLEPVNDETNKYITSCGHLFHLQCIFQYLEKKELLYPIHSGCNRLCCGAKKIKPFECVVCKTYITR